MPDDLLAPLGAGPVPPLAPAAVVRARGEQRRRRHRAVLAGSGAMVLVLAGTLGASLLTGGRPDALQPAAPAPTNEASTPRTWSPTDALLTPEDAAGVVADTWIPVIVDGPGPHLDPCGDGDYDRDAGQVAIDYAHMVVDRGPDDASSARTGFGQEVRRYPDSDIAAAAFDGYLSAVQRCPSTSSNMNPAGGRITHEVVADDDDGRVRTLLIRSQTSCPTCAVEFPDPAAAVYYAVQRVDDGVSVLLAGFAERDGPGLRGTRLLAAATADKLVRVVQG